MSRIFETISAITMMASLCVMVLSVVLSEAIMLSARTMVAGVVLFVLGVMGFGIDAFVKEIIGR